jgi:hypothetical protein
VRCFETVDSTQAIPITCRRLHNGLSFGTAGRGDAFLARWRLRVGQQLVPKALKSCLERLGF